MTAQSQLQFESDAQTLAISGKKKGSGPPNRLNDLPYREWMKFQKSFFRFKSFDDLASGCLTFFTKEIWPNGRTSRSLVITASDFDVAVKRNVQLCRLAEGSIFSILDTLQELQPASGNDFDFILLDLRSVNDWPRDRIGFGAVVSGLTNFMTANMREDLYCSILVPEEVMALGSYPLAWNIAQGCRGKMRLRDEKVGLVEQDQSVVFALFFQLVQDERSSRFCSPEELKVDQGKRFKKWVFPKSPPRKKEEIAHPAKFPESLVDDFILTFSSPGDIVFDPMLGTGSTVVSAIASDRVGLGVELNPAFVEVAKKRIDAANQSRINLFEQGSQSGSKVLFGDATQLKGIPELADVRINYAVTSPPYWSMLSNPGSENQRKRRTDGLQLVYSDSERDLGNVSDYDEFLDILCGIYFDVADIMQSGSVLTIVVKNIKRNHVLYPLAWDLAAKLGGTATKFAFLGTTYWCQDDIGLKPFAVGTHWVSNILHQYCLHFKKLA